MSPRLALSDYVDGSLGDTELSRENMRWSESLGGCANLLYLRQCQLGLMVRFAMLKQAVFHCMAFVSLRGDVFKVGRSVVRLIGINVIHLMPWWSFAKKGIGDHLVNRNQFPSTVLSHEAGRIAEGIHNHAPDGARKRQPAAPVSYASHIGHFVSVISLVRNGFPLFSDVGFWLRKIVRTVDVSPCNPRADVVDGVAADSIETGEPSLRLRTAAYCAHFIRSQFRFWVLLSDACLRHVNVYYSTGLSL